MPGFSATIASFMRAPGRMRRQASVASGDEERALAGSAPVAPRGPRSRRAGATRVPREAASATQHGRRGGRRQRGVHGADCGQEAIAGVCSLARGALASSSRAPRCVACATARTRLTRSPVLRIVSLLPAPPNRAQASRLSILSGAHTPAAPASRPVRLFVPLAPHRDAISPGPLTRLDTTNPLPHFPAA